MAIGQRPGRLAILASPHIQASVAIRLQISSPEMGHEGGGGVLDYYSADIRYKVDGCEPCGVFLES